MKDAEDEAFDDLAKRQGDWGSGFQAKRQMAADKQEPWNEDEWRRNNWRCSHGWLRGEQCEICNAAQPAQEPEREALKLAVNGLEKILHTFVKDGKVVMASMIRNELFAEVNSLLQQTKTSLAQPAQEPVAWITPDGEGFRIRFSAPTNDVPLGWDALYTTPPKLPWVGLTEEEVELYWDWEDFQTGAGRSTIFEMVRAIEAKLKEKNR